MSTFSVDITVANLNRPERHRRVSATVDTGATYTVLPREIVEDLGCRTHGSRQILLADGHEQEWPMTYVWITVDGREGPTLSLIGPREGPALLGAVTLEEFALGVDPVAQRLIPIRSYLYELQYDRGIPSTCSPT
jgi:clan AA aspartic protease